MMAYSNNNCADVLKRLLDTRWKDLNLRSNTGQYCRLRLLDVPNVVIHDIRGESPLVRRCEHGRIMIVSYHGNNGCYCSTLTSQQNLHHGAETEVLTEKPWRDSRWPLLSMQSTFEQKFCKKLGEQLAWRLEGGNGSANQGKSM
jgi:hypothetical protein